MLAKFLTLSLIIFTAVHAQAQEHPLQLKEGVYASAYTFLNVRPLPGVRVSVNEKNEMDEWITKLKITSDYKVNKQSLYKAMWGFYDGRSLYISSNSFMGDASYIRFSKVLYLGYKYSYFKANKDLNQVTQGGLGGVVGMISATDNIYLLNMENGLIERIDSDLLDKLLAEEAEVYHQYQQAEKSDENIMRYIRELDQRSF